MLALLALTAALAAPGLSLPPEAPAEEWGSVARLAGFELVAEGADVTVVPTGDSWEVRALGAEGQVRTAVVPAPATRVEREELAWLAASLLEEVTSPPLPPVIGPQPEPPPPDKPRRRRHRRAEAQPPPQPPEPPPPAPAGPVEDPDIARAREFARGLHGRLEPVVEIDDPPLVRERPVPWMQAGAGAYGRPGGPGQLGTGAALVAAVSGGIRAGRAEVGLGLRGATRREVSDLPKERGLRSLGADLVAAWTPGPLLLGGGAGVEVQSWFEGAQPRELFASPHLIASAGAEVPVSGSVSVVPLLQGRMELGSTNLFIGEEQVAVLSPWLVEARLDLRWRKR